MTERRFPFHGVLTVLVGLSSANACSSSPQTQGGAQCTYLQVIPCHGPGNCSGTQTCLPNLSGFTACECGDGAVTDAAQDGARGPG